MPIIIIMHKNILFLSIIIIATITLGDSLFAVDSYEVTSTPNKDTQFDKNTAFYEGDSLNYIFSPPDGFKLELEPAINDGYSFAFIKENEKYSSSDVTLTINIFKLEANQYNFDIEGYITHDTSSIKDHFGTHVVIDQIDSIFNSNGREITTYYINDKTRFIPNVMISYYNAGNEFLIFELVISPGYPRFQAEDEYIAMIRNFKTLIKGSFGKKP